MQVKVMKVMKVMKKMMKKVMKVVKAKKAMKKKALSKNKRKILPKLKKREEPEGKHKPDEDNEDAGDDVEPSADPNSKGGGRSLAQEAKAAARLAARKRKELEKLEAKKVLLAEQQKANSKAIRLVEKDFELLDADAKKKAKSVSQVKARKTAKLRKKQELKTQRLEARVNNIVRKASKHRRMVSASLNDAKAKAEDIKRVVDNAKAQYDHAVRTIQELGDDEYSMIGIVAAKSRTRAKSELKKAEARYQKIAELVAMREAKHQAVQDKIKQAKAQLQPADKEDTGDQTSTKSKDQKRTTPRLIKTHRKIKAMRAK